MKAGNRRFVAGQQSAREFIRLRARLSGGQQPRALILGCSDSRVSPELVFGQNLGDLFVVRAAGNVADALGLASIEYAVAELDTALLVVLGHYDCGAVKAACSGEKHPTPNVEALAKKIAPACQQGGGKQALNLSIEENIRRSAEDVLARSNLLGTEVEAGRLAVVKAVYDVASGSVQEVH